MNDGNVMRYVLAILLPPIAALAYGGCGSFLLNLLLCFFGYVPGMVHAVWLVVKRDDEEREERMMREIAKWQAHQELKMLSQLESFRKAQENIPPR